MPELRSFPPTTAPTLKVPQARVLAVLCPDVGDDPPLGTVPRFELAAAAGFVPTTGTINRVLNGIQSLNSTSGAPHPGLLSLGLVEKVIIDLDGQSSDSYRITRAGIRAIRAWLLHNQLPPKRDEKSCVNTRYANDDLAE